MKNRSNELSDKSLKNNLPPNLLWGVFVTLVLPIFQEASLDQVAYVVQTNQFLIVAILMFVTVWIMIRALVDLAR